MRITSIDLFRGLAILIMIFANSYPYLYPEEYCPKILRLIFSTAAPIFIFLSGVSLRLAIENEKKTSSLLIRAIQILFFAVTIDALLWSIKPFITMDVLYLISFSLLISILILRLPDSFKWAVSFSIIVLVFFTSKHFSHELNDIPIFEPVEEKCFSLALHHIFIDGWFPIVPWSSIVILGYLICKNRVKLLAYSNYLLIFGISCVLGYFVAFMTDFVDFNSIRNGYTELFYPVTIPFLFYMFGIFSLILYFFNVSFQRFKTIRLLGKFPLSIYFIHVALIKFYCPIYSPQSSEQFDSLVFYSGLITLYLIIFLCLFFLEHLANRIKQNKLAKFLVGI